MAESAASFLFNRLTLFLQQERELLGGIGDNALYIRDELGQMRAFLRVAEEKEETDHPQLKEWVKQVREISYDTEDVLETYMLKLARLQYPDSYGYKRYIKNPYTAVKKLMVSHRIASEFQKINLRMENVTKTQMTLKGIYDFKDQGSSSKTYDTRGDALLLEEEEVLGIEEPKKKLVGWLKHTDDGLMVISVVGMGGLGKTTLVKKVYDDASVKANFDSHVWVTVSENFNLERLLRDMINQLAHEVKLQPPQNLEAMDADEMKEYVYKFLKDKTYMTVLDDVWNIDVWESIRYAFPRNSACGRIIITSRSYHVGNAACRETCGHMYNLEPLTVDNSKTLFYKKAFPQNSCPPYLKEISESILKRCEGLPLAIVVIGGLLATKNNNFEDWKIFERTIGVELQGNNLKMMNRLLSLSYYDLPYYLKACFLYLSIFPEDELLEKWEVIRLWVAEGFVEEKEGMTLEEVAETYLNELLKRSLIQIANTDLDGSSFFLRIHDILREYIISKSREQNLFKVTSGGERVYPDKIRHMAIYGRFKERDEFPKVKYLRSLFWLEFADSKSGLDFHKVLGHCKLLKVLNLDEAPMETIPKEVFKLYHLKYLCLSRTNVKGIPKAIGNLQNLETLDLEQSEVIELPIEILKLRRLRHLLIGSKHYATPELFDWFQGLKMPYEIGSYLTSLQTLHWIDAEETNGIKIVGEVGKLTQLRRLGITKLRREDGRDLCSSLVKLTNLRWLYISGINEDEVIDLDNYQSSFTLPFLHTIILHGHLEKFPRWVCWLHGLTVVQLWWSRLIEDPLQHLEDLPNLVCLQMGMFAYEGEELIFKGGKFKKLERLSLLKLRGLTSVRVEKDCMSHLKRFDLEECEEMEELPEGIEHLSNLEHVSIAIMSEKFKRRLAEEKHKGGHEWKLAHIPRIEVWEKDVVSNEWKLQQL
ncbi:disease resistance protein RPM1-like isoform X2 [Henckelia pumila]|uniref:disease resistance protein RPM1-like isoform X2 n=1 Tax=Henckelia pumila TaxID=405737 RepID=UPI003C6E4EE8